MPVYNEEQVLFLSALASVRDCIGNKEIFVINDGSTRGMTAQQFSKLDGHNNITVHSFEANKGKREALYYATKNFVTDHEYVITIDSDTVLDKNALVELVRGMKMDNVGAATGDVQLLNENQNLLTRMIGAYYWIGLNIFKKAQSSIGIVVCCSGCIAGYRTEILTKIIDDFANQTFLGEKCTHSEDRHLTNLVLFNRYQVKYIPGAISFTHTPSTVLGFIKQQQRWKRGFIRESTFTLTYAWFIRPILFWQILLCELTMPFLAFGLTLALFVSIATNPHVFITAVLPSWIFFMFTRYIHMVFLAPRKILGLIVYMFMYEAVLYWQFVFALFTVKNKSWITRG